jgi:hypothetical protein
VRAIKNIELESVRDCRRYIFEKATAMARTCSARPASLGVGQPGDNGQGGAAMTDGRRRSGVTMDHQRAVVR